MSRYTAAILAGGDSERLGHDKALLRFGNQFLLDRIYAVVSEVIGDLRIIGMPRPDSMVNPDLFTEDLRPGLGPIGGLYTALSIFQAPVLLVSCDMPFIQSVHIRYLLNQFDGAYQAIVAAGPNGIEPLFSIYQGSSLPALKASIENGDYALYKFIKKLRVKFVNFNETVENSNLFFNINTLSDYKKVLYLKKHMHEYNRDKDSGGENGKVR